MGGCMGKEKVRENVQIERENIKANETQPRLLQFPAINPPTPRVNNGICLFVVKEANQILEETIKSPGLINSRDSSVAKRVSYQN